jgi:hypothetical protein
MNSRYFRLYTVPNYYYYYYYFAEENEAMKAKNEKLKGLYFYVT